MSLSTFFWLVNVLETPTMEKMIFSSAIESCGGRRDKLNNRRGACRNGIRLPRMSGVRKTPTPFRHSLLQEGRTPPFPESHGHSERFGMTKIRISEGKSKFTCILPSESIFGAANDTKSRARRTRIPNGPINRSIRQSYIPIKIKNRDSRRTYDNFSYL